MIEASIRCRLSEDIFFPPSQQSSVLQCRILEAVCVTLISEVNAEELQPAHQVLCRYEQSPLGAAASAGGPSGVLSGEPSVST